MQLFTTQLWVRHYEMDALGHVNNAVYQHYLEHAAIEHSKQLGFTPARYQTLGGMFVMRRMQIEYLRPAIAGDHLAISTWLFEMRGSRAIRRYEIRKTGQSDLLVSAEALWVWVDLATMRPKAIPSTIAKAFGQYATAKEMEQFQSVQG
jgi:acyl-CoA thioester hydrolase